MSLILHIFQKDVRHLWREILVTLAALAMMTETDIWRYDYLPWPSMACSIFCCR